MKVLDKLTGFIEQVVNQTSTSWEITQKKRTEKGINTTNWFDITSKSFKERFETQEVNHE